MDKQPTKYLWALREINKSLITGLETAVFVMEKWDDLAPTRRKSIIQKLQGLIKQSNEAFETKPPEHWSEHPMPKKPDEKELVSFKEMLMANSIQVDAVPQLLIEKGVFTEEEFHSKLSQVVHECQEKQKGKME